MLRVQTRNFLLGCALSAEESGARSTQLRRRGRLTGSRPAAVEPFGMMPSRLSSKRPDLMNKDAEHASLKLDQAAETDAVTWVHTLLRLRDRRDRLLPARLDVHRLCSGTVPWIS